MSTSRTDRNNNPTAFTVDLAKQAGLEFGVDYVAGEPFEGGQTAKLRGDPVAITIRLIHAVGYYTGTGRQRWSYIAIPKFIWAALTYDQKRDIIGFMYKREGGTAMRNLFPNYGEL